MIFTIGERENGARLDRSLQALTGLSRKKVKALLDTGRVVLNNRKVVIASWEVKRGDRLQVLKETDERHPDAKGHFLKVLYEDPHLLVVKKEAGIPCESSPITTAPTLVEIINVYLRRRSPGQKGHYLGLVHRLDRETSGVMVYTKSREANRITDQFKRHTIVRRYLAIVAGPVAREEGTISGFLAKSPLLKGGKKAKPSTEATGRKATTRWRLLERYPDASLLEVDLDTGRTHQIRVHLASIGHPVIGDKIYGTSPIPFPRQALHAAYLCFRHPITGKKMEFRSELPRDLKKLVDRLRLKS